MGYTVPWFSGAKSMAFGAEGSRLSENTFTPAPRFTEHRGDRLEGQFKRHDISISIAIPISITISYHNTRTKIAPMGLPLRKVVLRGGIKKSPAEPEVDYYSRQRITIPSHLSIL